MGPVLEDRSGGAMRLKSTAYLLLGMLRMGVSSGYAIKRTADASTHFFWPTSLAQVYPQLAELEGRGLVSRRDDHHGARVRSAYELTSEGEAMLQTWLRSDREVAPQMRDEGLLRMFFADALPEEEQLALVGRLRRRAQRFEAVMRREGLVAAKAVREHQGLRFPEIAARFGADLWSFCDDWLANLESELEADA